ncbi:hypothetical protein BD779DRAFT_1666569 [Infundibulicybe gibba]|nr:hypothetical protein BD779DRAFT_1666569 [Infundibulicybe gibba]
MLRHSAPDDVSLEYLRPSPVRGQLEPHDPKTAKGWRYLQTTDTIDQLKVLLPPGTAAMYEQLLKLEAYELAKRSTVSWSRIVEIRHLKDRMIRKCRKLSSNSSATKLGQRETFAFQTIIAPPDFRVKEMERWFQQQQKRANMGIRSTSGSRQLAITAGPQSPVGNHELYSASILDTPQSENILRIAPRPSSPIISPTPPSPPPLPHLLRVSGFTGDGIDFSFNQSSPEGSVPNTPPSDADSPPPAEGKTASEVTLRRRRSCIKRSSSDMVKTVSWADDRGLGDRLRDYTVAAQEVQSSGRKWEEIRAEYLEQMAGLESLHNQVEESLGRLRSETEHLQRVDESIRAQRETLNITFAEFEKKQMEFQSKVEVVLAEADKALSLEANQEVDAP